MTESKIKSLDELYQLALSDIKGKPGSIMIYVDGIPQVSHTNDIIGNCLQEWLPAWFKDHGLDMQETEKTQEFPDFTANFGNEHYPMDIKCWNYDNSPAFDLANFDSFYRTTWNDPIKIFAKYLIIGYRPTSHGFEIVDIFLKNIWDITSKSSRGQYPIGLQVKQSRPYAIRPYNFVKKPGASFKNANEFVKAIYDTRIKFPSNGYDFTPNQWLDKIQSEIAYQNTI